MPERRAEGCFTRQARSRSHHSRTRGIRAGRREAICHAGNNDSLSAVSFLSKGSRPRFCQTHALCRLPLACPGSELQSSAPRWSATHRHPRAISRPSFRVTGRSPAASMSASAARCIFQYPGERAPIGRSTDNRATHGGSNRECGLTPENGEVKKQTQLTGVHPHEAVRTRRGHRAPRRQFRSPAYGSSPPRRSKNLGFR